MMDEKTRSYWKEFVDSGVLDWANMNLYTFGWKLLVEYDFIDDIRVIRSVTPIRVMATCIPINRDIFTIYEKILKYMSEKYGKLKLNDIFLDELYPMKKITLVRWEEFERTQILYWINMFMSTFGWELKIIYGKRMGDGSLKINNVYPITSCGGLLYDELSQINIYDDIEKYMLKNSKYLLEFVQKRKNYIKIEEGVK